MNSNVSPNDDDEDPLHLCPSDLKKLQHRYDKELQHLNISIGFDVLERYSQLLDWYQKHNWESEAEWAKVRIEYLNRQVD
jgi:hypothetical protein